ncbi:E3 ubiquitin-protein ligase RNF8-like isoform X1 [Metopolophium dirhodum]|uniref:E3 ubiquitin-protein ligase RNF8-like isoform X1 n=1 Tax=Metopolophium dirhodum TaxID=44670 RepID=UPI00298FB0C9|nr:E3 ubiquitin-protein ligase RNF8-like isoform X1 [Metopolophium dirhodum]
MSSHNRYSTTLASAISQLKAKPTEMEKKIIAKMLDFNDLTCSICFDIFDKPAELNCSHVFCFKCIKNWMRNNKSCPMCRRNTIEPPVVCTMLEKLISEMQSVSVPVVNRRYTIGTVYKAQEPLATTRPAGKRELNGRPPWR